MTPRGDFKQLRRSKTSCNNGNNSNNTNKMDRYLQDFKKRLMGLGVTRRNVGGHVLLATVKICQKTHLQSFRGVGKGTQARKWGCIWGLYELLSKLLVSPLITPIVVPYSSPLYNPLN